MLCKAIAYPEATVQWYKDEKVVSPSNYNTTITFINITASETASTFELPVANVNDTGTYYCLFSTRVGSLRTPNASFIYSSKLHDLFHEFDVIYMYSRYFKSSAVKACKLQDTSIMFILNTNIKKN